MGFWDDKVDNPIDRMFDFDRDGELNSTEKAMEFDFLSGGNSSNIFLNDFFFNFKMSNFNQKINKRL